MWLKHREKWRSGSYFHVYCRFHSFGGCLSLRNGFYWLHCVGSVFREASYAASFMPKFLTVAFQCLFDCLSFEKEEHLRG